MPIVVAWVLKLVLQPVMRLLHGWHLPNGVAALLVILVLFGGVAGLAATLSAPAASWAEKLPAGVPKLEQRLSVVSRPIGRLQEYVQKAEALAPGVGPSSVPVQISGAGAFNQLLAGTRSLATGLFETALVLFFLLLSGDTFLRRLVETLPRFRSKRQAVEIAQEIERDVSRYLLTITILNLVVGVAYGTAALFCGLDDPLLWGAVAFLLNFVPILGPTVGVAVFTLVGLLSFSHLWQALLPAVLYLTIHTIVTELVQPIVVARRFTINPGHRPRAGLLVLDVGRARSGARDPTARHRQDHLRPHRPVAAVRSFHRRLSGGGWAALVTPICRPVPASITGKGMPVVAPIRRSTSSRSAD